VADAHGAFTDAAAFDLVDIRVGVDFAVLATPLVPEMDVDSPTRASVVPEFLAAGSVDRKPVTVSLDGDGDLAAGRRDWCHGVGLSRELPHQ